MKLLVLSDTHCGSLSGLTPPKWQSSDAKLRKVQNYFWKFYRDTISSLGGIDAVVAVGDLIDGKQKKSGGRGLSTADRLQQVKIAAEVLRASNAPQMHIVTGTPYHTGDSENWEEVLAGIVGAKTVGPRLAVEHDGYTIIFRHAIDRSSVPHGKATAPLRALMWNKLNAARGMEPQADLCVFGHVHYHVFAGDAYGTALTLPALQLGTEYGAACVDGDYDVGLLEINLEEGDNWWKVHTLDLRPVALQAIQL